ncbi:putative porin [Flavobacterium sp. CYK-4]|uniref:putative porin n=1 Tax=Flavobacterium lotistagni TaxID=2709660 RepID=UPI00140762F8|nr:putative porin [Flavobacterium lotistagni]NHM05614.1 putative porin [Flavobacterium lotistagni]
MRILFISFLFLSFSLVYSQEPKQEEPKKSLLKSQEQKDKELARKAPITSYRMISLDRDTTYVDTSLTIKKEYEYNYLRKDIFGLMPFLNEGQTYTTLQHSFNRISPYPEIGYQGKHFNYIQANQVKYYSVATPLTDLYFKTVMEQGQSLDAFLTVNTSEQFNFSIAYKGLRSLGKYINQLSSTGNFRVTSSYHTKSFRYSIDTHYTGQDFLNGENGGITTPEDFESKDPAFKQRPRLEVYLLDATSFLKGKRFFFDHQFRINPTKGNNNLYLTHQFNYETKFYEYYQPTVTSTIGDTFVNRFGDAYVSSGVNDHLRYNRMYNKVGAIYESNLLGKFHFFLDDFRYNYFYNTIVIRENQLIPNAINDKINGFGAQYDYLKNRWRGTLAYTNSITNQSLTNIEANLAYEFNAKNKLLLGYQNTNKLPDHLYNLHQSSFIDYNWFNNFKNEKINTLTATARTQWAEVSMQLSNYDNHLFFSDDSANPRVQLISPKQYEKSIQYFSVKVNKEIKYWRFALDNTILYQQTQQDDQVLNVPKIVTRNTLYYSGYFFTKALYLQSGVTLNYFTKYYANGYNPVVSDFFVQNNQKIGDFPMLDFFINARIRQCRIFLKAEHFNSAFSSKNKFYSAPDYPYRDFIVRFGLVWNFFQ